MKKTLVCPKCDGHKIWHIEHLVLPMPAADLSGLTGEMRVMGLLSKTSWRGIFSKGLLEAFSCHACGYTEFYASGLDERDANPEEGIHFIDNEPISRLR